MKTKIIPFNAKMAKDIQAGVIEGRIVRNGCEVNILDYNSKKYLGYPIRIVYLNIDEVDYVSSEGLHIEMPDNEPQFKPFDKVLVRSGNDDSWEPRLFARYVKYPDKEELYYYTQDDTIYDECIPYEGNEHLVGTTDKPKED